MLYDDRSAIFPFVTELVTAWKINKDLLEEQQQTPEAKYLRAYARLALFPRHHKLMTRQIDGALFRFAPWNCPFGA